MPKLFRCPHCGATIAEGDISMLVTYDAQIEQEGDDIVITKAQGKVQPIYQDMKRYYCNKCDNEFDKLTTEDVSEYELYEVYVENSILIGYIRAKDRDQAIEKGLEKFRENENLQDELINSVEVVARKDGNE